MEKKTERTCDPRDPHGIERGGERDRNLLRLEAFDAAAHPGIGVGQIDGFSTQALIKRDGNRREGTVQSGRNPGMDGSKIHQNHNNHATESGGHF